MRPATQREKNSPYNKANPKGIKNNSPQMIQLKKLKKIKNKNKKLVIVKKGRSRYPQKVYKKGLDDLDPSEILDAI